MAEPRPQSSGFHIVVREFEEEPLSSQSSPNQQAENVAVVGSPLASREYYVTSGPYKKCITRIVTEPRSKALSFQERLFRLLHAPLTVAKELFLPIGFPHSVKHGYLEYQLFDSLQGLCSYLRGVLCSAQVLQAAGVGNENATAWAAAVTWALKDGMGMMGGLVFSYVAAPLFDAYTKEFRLFADVINDVGLTLDMLAPLYCQNNSTMLLFNSSASTLCKTLCGMSAAATKANITHYFAIQGNMADLNAKESTQETLVSLLGMALGVALATRLQQLEQNVHHSNNENLSFSAFFIQWLVFSILTAIHVWANYKGVCLLHLPTLNRERAQVVFQSIFVPCDRSSKTQMPKSLKRLEDIDFPSPDQVRESLVASTSKMLFPGRIQLDARLVEMIHIKGTSHEIMDRMGADDKYVLTVDRGKGGRVLACLLCGATPVDEIKAFCHANWVAQYLQASGGGGSGSGSGTWSKKDCDWDELIHETKKQLAPLFDNPNKNLMLLLKKKGWDLDGRLYLGFSRRRFEFVGSSGSTNSTSLKKEN